jgi:transmembrane sensor
MQADSGESLVVSSKDKMQWKKIAVAASIVGVLFMVGYWLFNKTTDDGPQSIAENKLQDVKAPNKTRAQITLADGTTVYLDEVANGQLADVNGVKLVKTGDGKIEYSPSTSAQGESLVVSGELKYNTLSNPRGSKVIDMRLSDGSRVWLNAGSTITYPIVFTGNERKVTMSGEGYFEVSTKYDAGGTIKQPFIVSKGDVSVTVLGTHFNVNAYDDEPEIRVTLLEGSVRVQPVADSKKSVVIKPGEQAQVMVSNPSTPLRVNKDVDTDEVMAWKNGMFSYQGTDLNTVMRQVARWYDVEIEYETTIDEKFYGDISRNTNMSNLFKMLETTGSVHFKIEGKKVTVMKGRK